MEEHPLPNFLTDAAIKGLPDTAFYIPQFISLLEEELLLQKVPANCCRVAQLLIPDPSINNLTITS